MKAKNEIAEAFQAKVADEIIPSIRKTGSYSTTTPALPDFTNPAEAALSA
jgi:prophage antirepressor-like protein